MYAPQILSTQPQQVAAAESPPARFTEASRTAIREVDELMLDRAAGGIRLRGPESTAESTPITPHEVLRFIAAFCSDWRKAA